MSDDTKFDTALMVIRDRGGRPRFSPTNLPKTAPSPRISVQSDAV